MRRTWIALFVLALLALDWAALHDILKGEPDVWLECRWSWKRFSAAFVVRDRRHHSV